MTKLAWSTVVDHTSDVGFRAWGSEFAAKLAAAGLVQTADTGQINWATVTRAAPASNAGYEIWRFNDALQATAPIYMRIDYGTHSGASSTRVNITVGTGSNGSGTITGTALTAARTINQNGGDVGPPSGPGRQSLLCHVAGFFGIAWKLGSVGRGWFCIARTVDTNGDPTATGALIQWGQSGTSQALRFAATAIAYTFATASKHVLIPHSPANSLVGADAQVYLHWTITPRVEPVNQVCSVFLSEFGQGSTFQINLVGATTRTYISVGDTGMTQDAGGLSAATICGAMLWE